jgi:hypothetical protein
MSPDGSELRAVASTRPARRWPPGQAARARPRASRADDPQRPALRRPALRPDLPGHGVSGGRGRLHHAAAVQSERWRMPAGTLVSVCENPSVLAAAAGTRPTVGCVEGRPSVAANLMLASPAEGGARLRYHGDFGAGGISIANGIIGGIGAEPWRFRAADHSLALDRAPGCLARRSGRCEPWCPARFGMRSWPRRCRRARSRSKKNSSWICSCPISCQTDPGLSARQVLSRAQLVLPKEERGGPAVLWRRRSLLSDHFCVGLASGFTFRVT